MTPSAFRRLFKVFLKQAGQKSVKEELPKQGKGPNRAAEYRLKVPTHISKNADSCTGSADDYLRLLTEKSIPTAEEEINRAPH